MSDNLDAIKHVVVLMMENRSFDTMLGFLKELNPEIEGLKGDETIPTDPSLLGQGDVDTVQVMKTADSDGYICVPDPGHEHLDVNVQLFGVQTVPPGAIPRNDGFVLSYSQAPDAKGVPIGIEAGKRIMKCFDPVAQLPVLSTLAQNFALCDHWFCSVPGPTWPNRFFVHAATSNGHIDSPGSLEAVKDELGFGHYGMRSIYEHLVDQKLSWKIYYHDFPQSLALTNLHRYRDQFQEFSQFIEDAKHGALPSYCFIEPAYFNFPEANDQHPPHDVRNGEALIARVYNAVRNNEEVWKHCLLVVIYDEHGGFYDHVPPPRAINPDGKRSEAPAFNFDRLGVRTPAVLVSPYVRKGAVDHTIYDHTSLLATTKKIFDLPTFLTKRDAAANTFEHNITADFRADTPPFVTPPQKPLKEALAAEAVQVKEPLSKYQQSLLALAAIINTPKVPTTQKDSLPHVKGQLDQFLKK
jgi:phospholipase C